MDRADKAGLSVAAAAHVLLFGALSLGWLMRPAPLPPPPPAIDVSLVDKVGLEATAPQAVTPPAQSKAPELGPPEPAPATPPKAVEPDPAPPMPQPKAAPPPKPSPAPPQPKKPVAAKPDAAKAPPKREASAPAAKDSGKHARGSSLGDIMKGIGAQPTKSVSQTPQAATMSAQAQMDIASKILQQVQPCANRQAQPGPGAERIRVIIHLKLRRDGSLIGNPEVIGYDGTDDENSRYLDRVKDNAIATFKGCSPLRDLPQELYDVPRGWSDFKMRYRWTG
ncbi:MAG: cell envelope biogenesis protein TolA [Sphingomonas sp.]